MSSVDVLFNGAESRRRWVECVFCRQGFMALRCHACYAADIPPVRSRIFCLLRVPNLLVVLQMEEEDYRHVYSLTSGT
ncbi:hypothetical protein PUN28_017988 [Cardiocondyla obscurior]|uniref:Uncharacterized protein n=1 Tax=Cardiocondyla obscurior TaxID=286306 RepID=A0AAW2EL87_9HYME